MSNKTLYNQDCKLILAGAFDKGNEKKQVYLENPNGSIKCIGVLMGTINSTNTKGTRQCN